LPFSESCKRCLSYAAEAVRFKHKQIDCRHLMLGLLKKDGMAADILEEFGITYTVLADMVNEVPTALNPVFELRHEPVRSAERASLIIHKLPPEPLQNSVAALRALVDSSLRHLEIHSDGYGDQRLKRQDWSRKEAMGHLIDWATAHHQWLATALVEPSMNAREYPQDDRVKAQHYDGCSWPDLVDTWVSLNRILIQVLTHMPDDKVNAPCRVGIEKPVPLSVLVGGYVMHNEDIMGQIVAKL
jgi:hypothetical protein